MARKYFYRVTRGDSGSWFVSDENIRVVCEKDEWCYPKIKGSKLFVFKELKHAKQIASSTNIIWKCEVKNPEKFKRMLEVDDINKYNVIKFWNDGLLKHPSYVMGAWRGTYLVDAFKPVEIME